MRKSCVAALVALALSLALVGPSQAGLFGETWQETELRLNLNLAEWVFAGNVEHEGPVRGRGYFMVGAAWRPLDDAGVVQDWGLWVGGSLDVSNAPYNWIELGGGVLAQEWLSLGVAGWLGNRYEWTEEAGTDSTAAYLVQTIQPGAMFKGKAIIGIGTNANAD